MDEMTFLPTRSLMSDHGARDGAYSFVPKHADSGVRRLLSGQVRPGLFLCGSDSHCEWPGTLHGAVFSGQAVSRAILSQHSRASADPIVVIGAGVTGLTVAADLRKAGACCARACVRALSQRRLCRTGRDVVVLESESYLGGRAFVDRSLGFPCHMGAAWCVRASLFFFGCVFDGDAPPKVARPRRPSAAAVRQH